MDNNQYNKRMRFHSPEKIERWKRWTEKARYMPVPQVALSEINPRTGKPYRKQAVYKGMQKLALLISQGAIKP